MALDDAYLILLSEGRLDEALEAASGTDSRSLVRRALIRTLRLQLSQATYLVEKTRKVVRSECYSDQTFARGIMSECFWVEIQLLGQLSTGVLDEVEWQAVIDVAENLVSISRTASDRSPTCKELRAAYLFAGTILARSYNCAGESAQAIRAYNRLCRQNPRSTHHTQAAMWHCGLTACHLNEGSEELAGRAYGNAELHTLADESRLNQARSGTILWSIAEYRGDFAKAREWDEFVTSRYVDCETEWSLRQRAIMILLGAKSRRLLVV